MIKFKDVLILHNLEKEEISFQIKEYSEFLENYTKHKFNLEKISNAIFPYQVVWDNNTLFFRKEEVILSAGQLEFDF